MTGQLLAQRYRLQELVGRGAAAGVYRALDESLGREVALKVFAREGGEPELLARQEAEIRILASLIHPSLVTLFDAGTDPAMERSFVVMEYVPGPDLRRLLREEPPEQSSIASMGSDLASALDYVHSRGVIHRDIKPGNVLLYKPRPWEPESRWRAKLADFGIARVMEEEHLTGTGRMVGTAAYLSPEQALGEGLGGASDVYSLGLVLLECFTRHVEFPGGQIESGVARLNRDPVIPDSLGVKWQELLAAMTARHPADRPTAAEAASALQQLASQPLAPVIALAPTIATAPAVAMPPVAAAPVEAAPVQQHAVGPLPPVPSRRPGTLRQQRRKLGKRARAAIGAGIAAVILAGATSATFGGVGPGQSAGPADAAGPIVPVQNNPVDFHLDQLEEALKPAAALQPLLNQVRQAVLAGDLKAAMTHLDRLEEEVADEAAREGLTFEQYRSISTAIRLVRNDVQTLMTATEGQTAEAVPVVADPLPAGTPEAVPAVEPQPVIIVAPAPAVEANGDDAAQQPAEAEQGNAGPADIAKAKAGKPDNPGGKHKD